MRAFDAFHLLQKMRQAGIACLTVRLVLPVGRRKHGDKDLTSHTTSRKRRGLEQHELDTSAYLDVFPELQPEEKELFAFLLSKPECLDPFVVCSSFPK
jgi:hypothetical protein